MGITKGTYPASVSGTLQRIEGVLLLGLLLLLLLGGVRTCNSSGQLRGPLLWGG